MMPHLPLRGRMKRTWMEVVTLNLKKCNLSKALVLDRSECGNRVHVAAPTIVGTRL